MTHSIHVPIFHCQPNHSYPNVIPTLQFNTPNTPNTNASYPSMSGPYDSQYYSQGYPQYQTAYTGHEQYNTYNSYPQQGFAPQNYSQPEQARYYSQSYDPSHQSQPQYGQPPQEGDRGVLGALGGGAAGGVAGKRMGHGFLGTIGGAIVGSLAEDFAKQKNKKHKHGRKDRRLPSGGSSTAGGFGSMASSLFNQKR